MSDQQFSVRRSVVGWICLVYGLICMGTILSIPGGYYQSYSASLIIGSICSISWVIFSAIAKGLRTTKRYNESILAMSLICAVGALFFHSMSTDKYIAPDMPKDNIERAIKRGTGELGGGLVRGRLRGLLERAENQGAPSAPLNRTVPGDIKIATSTPLLTCSWGGFFL